jgi:hypothetical protein
MLESTERPMETALPCIMILNGLWRIKLREQFPIQDKKVGKEERFALADALKLSHKKSSRRVRIRGLVPSSCFAVFSPFLEARIHSADPSHFLLTFHIALPTTRAS